MKESLIDIDVYITAKMEKAKQIMQSDVPTGMGVASVKSATICSNIVDPTQATVAKMEQVSDGHVEGNTILQLDQMRRIQPTGGTPELAPPTAGDSTNNQDEDVYPQEYPLDAPMAGVNRRDIISTPVEDAMTEIMNTSAEDATLEDISDSKVKNGYASIENIEVRETVGPTDNIKVYEKATAELQECATAPSINGQGTVCKPSVGPEVYMILGVSLLNEQLQKITGASENAGTIEGIVDTRTGDITGQGMMGQPFSATGLGETLNMSMNKLSTMQGDAEPPSGFELEEPAAAVPVRNELQGAVQTQPENNVAVQKPIFRENVKDPVENGSLNTEVMQKPAEDFLITIIEERTQRCVKPFTGEATDTILREESTGDEDRGNPDPNEISKRRKLKIPSHENSEVCSTIEATKLVGNAKTQNKTHQNASNASGQLIAFTRRKRKHLCNSRPDP
uniref:Uncharacterized protein n=1 Tax=Arundo donax TaxID=35708 RepID=A0A0A9G7R9_ARUDO